MIAIDNLIYIIAIKNEYFNETSLEKAENIKSL